MKPNPANRFVIPFLSAAACFAMATGAHGQSTQTYQDSSGLNTWNLADGNWDTGALWTDGNDAVFGGTGEAVTLGTVSAHDITFNVVNYTLGSGTLTLTGTAPTITAHANATINSTVAGSAGLAKAGAGVLALGGTNSYTGTTSIDSGVLSVAILAANGGNSGIGAGTDLSLNGGTLRYTGGNNGSDGGAKFNRNISVGADGGTLDLAGSGFLFYGGTLTGSGTLKVIDSSGDASNRQLLVTGNSAGFSGNLEIGNGSANSGWVQYRSNAANPFGTGTITVKTGGILSSDNGSTAPGTLANNIILSGGTLGAQSASTNYTGSVTATTGITSSLATNLSGNANIVLSGTLLGNGTLQKSGGTWSVELRGDNSGFTGTYNHIADGATILYTANSGSAAAVWNTSTNAAARFLAGAANGTYKLGALYGTTGRIENLNQGSGNSIFEIGELNTDTTFSGAVQNGGGGTVGITKVGTGTLILAGATSYTGNTTVNNGTLRYNFSGNLGSATITNNANVEFFCGGAGTAMVSGKLSGSGTWTVDGPGGGDQWSNRVVLTGTGSDHTGAISVINGGKLWSQLTATNNPIGDTADVSLATGTVFNLYGTAGAKETIGTLSGSGTVDFSDGGGGKALTLEVGGGNKDGSFGGTIQNSGLSGGPTVLSISKTGTGIQVLSGTHTYSGSTTITAGTLRINGSTHAASAFTVGVSGTLGGTGVIGGAVEVSGTLAPGASIESLATGALTMNAGSTFAYEVGADHSADLLTVNGTLSLTGVTLGLDSATLSNLGLNTWLFGDKLTLISYTGGPVTSGFDGYADDTSYLFGANEWLFNYDDPASGSNYQSEATGSRFVTMTLVPEPSAALLGGLGMVFLLRRRR